MKLRFINVPRLTFYTGEEQRQFIIIKKSVVADAALSREQLRATAGRRAIQIDE